MAKNVLCYGLILLFCLVSNVWSKDLELAEVVTILNTLRQSIKSGELRVVSEEVEIRSTQYIEERKARDKKWVDHAHPHELDYKDEILSYLSRRERKTLVEKKISFEVNTGSTALAINHYKIVSFDRDALNPLKGVGRYVHAGYCRVDTYDGQLGALEIDFPSIKSEIALYNTPTVKQSFAFHLFGRALKHIPLDAQAELTWKPINGESLCEIQFTTTDPYDRLTDIKLLVDPNQSFAVLKEEHFVEDAIVFSANYKQFKEKNSIFYPTESDMKFYGPSGLKQQFTFEVKEMAFNVEFPPDFFTVERTMAPGQRIQPYSPVKPIPRTQPVQGQSTQKATLPMCGPLSLQFVCEAFKVKTELDELLKLTNYKENIGTSMKGLYDAALQKKLNPEGILIRSKRFDDIRLPAIAHIDGNHFVVVTATSEREVKVFDPASDIQTLPIENFKSRWDGTLLTFAPTDVILPSTEPLVQSAPLYSTAHPQIQVHEAEHDFGRIRGGQQVEHIFTITNIGKRPLQISEIESSCGCTTAFLSDPTILPGKDLQLKVQFEVPKQGGATEQFIRFQTNAPDQPTFELKVKADVYLPLKVMPSHVYLGKVPSDTPVTRIIEVEYAPNHVEILGLRASSDVIRAKLLDDKYRLEIRAHPQIVGLISEKISVDYREQDEQLVLEIPIHGQVIGDFELSSNSIFFGIVDAKAGNVSRDVIITATKPNLKILRVETQSNNVSTEIIALGEDGKYKIKISLQPAGHTSSLLKDSVKIHTNSERQKKLEISVYAQTKIE